MEKVMECEKCGKLDRCFFYSGRGTFGAESTGYYCSECLEPIKEKGKKNFKISLFAGIFIVAIVMILACVFIILK